MLEPFFAGVVRDEADTQYCEYMHKTKSVAIRGWGNIIPVLKNTHHTNTGWVKTI